MEQSVFSSLFLTPEGNRKWFLGVVLVNHHRVYHPVRNDTNIGYCVDLSAVVLVSVSLPDDRANDTLAE